MFVFFEFISGVDPGSFIEVIYWGQTLNLMKQKIWCVFYPSVIVLTVGFPVSSGRRKKKFFFLNCYAILFLLYLNIVLIDPG